MIANNESGAYTELHPRRKWENWQNLAIREADFCNDQIKFTGPSKEELTTLNSDVGDEIVRCCGLRRAYKAGFGLDDWIYWHRVHTTENYRQCSAIADLHNLQFTVTHTLGFSVLTSRILATDLLQSRCYFESRMKPPNSIRAIILQLPIPKTRLNSVPLLPSSYPGRLASWNSANSSQRQVKVTLQTFITLWQLWSCFSGAPSLTRRRVCLLHMLLAFASVVVLESESFETRDHLLLSQIWDFPFRRLLRLAGSRWRYSNPPPHG
jgi:hypothetical protein